jgi:hypothetical protein
MPPNQHVDLPTGEKRVEQLARVLQGLARAAQGQAGKGLPFTLTQYDGSDWAADIRSLETGTSPALRVRNHNASRVMQLDNTGFAVSAPSVFTGNTQMNGTLDVSGNFKVNTNKFTVEASSGNTLIAGTGSVTGNLLINTDKFVVTASDGSLDIGPNNFVVDGADGSLDIGNGAFLVDGDDGSLDIGAGVFEVDATSGLITNSATFYIDGDAVDFFGGGLSKLLIDADGIIFFGESLVPTVPQQVGGAATADATYGNTERDMINAMYSALRAYGLLT